MLDKHDRVPGYFIFVVILVAAYTVLLLEVKGNFGVSEGEKYSVVCKGGF